MKKVLFVLCGLVLVVTIMGCGSTKMYTATKERVDAEVSGNQGIIYGPTPAPHKVAVPTRDVFSVDVELLTISEGHEAVKANPPAPTQDKEVTGNAGVVSQTPPKAEKIK